MRKIIRFVAAIILFIVLSILLGLFFLHCGERVYLIFIPVFWMFYFPMSWGLWREVDEDDLPPVSAEGLARFIPTRYRVMFLKYTLFAPGYFIITSFMIFSEKK